MAAFNRKVCKLKYPVTTEIDHKAPDGSVIPKGTVVHEITLRRIKAKDLRVVGESGVKGFDGTLKVIGGLNNLPIEIMDEVDAADITQIMGDMEPFLEGLAGAKPSS